METTQPNTQRTTIAVEFTGRKYRTQSVKNNEGVVIKPSRLIFVYGLKGTVEQHAEYKAIKGEKFREDDKTKQPLFFSTKYVDLSAEIVKSKDGKDWNIHNEDAELLANLTSQYGIDVAKDMIAKMPKA